MKAFQTQSWKFLNIIHQSDKSLILLKHQLVPLLQLVFYKVMDHILKEQYFFVFLNGTHRCWCFPFCPDFQLGIVIQ